MNNVTLIGRLTKDPEVRYTASQMAVATFTVAIDRPVRAGGEKQTDFPRVTCFGRQAENCERYLAKGRLVGVQGRIQTGSYQNKDGMTVYTTDVVADRVEFLERADRPQGNQPGMSAHDAKITADFKRNAELREEEPDGFQALDETVPF